MKIWGHTLGLSPRLPAPCLEGVHLSSSPRCRALLGTLGTAVPPCSVPAAASSRAGGYLKTSVLSQPRAHSPSSHCCTPAWPGPVPALQDLPQHHWGQKNKGRLQPRDSRSTHLCVPILHEPGTPALPPLQPSMPHWWLYRVSALCFWGWPCNQKHIPRLYLSVVAMLVSVHPMPRHPPAAWWGWLRGTVALMQQHLVAVPFTPGGHAFQLAHAGGHVQCRQ